jgi:RHS repeat-associated protein
VTDFRHEGDRVVAEVATTGSPVVTRTFTLDEAGTIVKLAIATTPTPGADDGTYLVTWNGHGDALALSEINTDGTLTRANRFAYTTWGTPNLVAETGYGDLGFRYRYVGQHGVAWDDFASAGLLYMSARHYAPEFGRFLQPDPSAAEANLYAYAANSPVTKVDPSGLAPWSLYSRDYFNRTQFFLNVYTLARWGMCVVGGVLYGPAWGATCGGTGIALTPGYNAHLFTIYEVWYSYSRRGMVEKYHEAVRIQTALATRWVHSPHAWGSVYRNPPSISACLRQLRFPAYARSGCGPSTRFSY